MGILDNIITGAKTGLGAVTGFAKNIPQVLRQVKQPMQQITENVPQSIEHITQPTQTAMGQIQQQAKTNAIVKAIKNSNLNPANWNDVTRQTIGNAFLGIGKTAFTNPNKDAISNIFDGINSGIQNQIAYRNAANTLQNNGINISNLSPYADYSKFTPEKAMALGIKMRQDQTRREIANASDIIKKQKMIFEALNKGDMTPEEAQLRLKALDFETKLQESNDTKKTNSQIELNKAKTEKTKAETKQVGKPKVSISIRKGGTKSTVDIRHNGGSGSSGNNTSYVKNRGNNNSKNNIKVF